MGSQSAGNDPAECPTLQKEGGDHLVVPESALVLSGLAEVERARERLEGRVAASPLVLSQSFSESLGRSGMAKLESEQVTGSFKFRGAMNKALAAKERGAAVLVTASSGNHALALAKCAGLLGLGLRVLLPQGVSVFKREMLKATGAELIEVADDDPVVAEVLARGLHDPNGGIEFVSPYNDLEVVAGHSSIVEELVGQTEDVPLWISCATGGGGLAAGIGLGLRRFAHPGSMLISCAPEASDVLANAVRRGYVAEEPIGPTLSTATAGNIELGSITVGLCADLVDEFVAVTEEEIRGALNEIRAEFGATVEGAAGVALAGALKADIPVPDNGVPLFIVCGMNADRPGPRW